MQAKALGGQAAQGLSLGPEPWPLHSRGELPMCEVLPHLRTQKPPWEVCPDTITLLGVASKAEGFWGS